jgi:hypothetical protein
MASLHKSCGTKKFSSGAGLVDVEARKPSKPAASAEKGCSLILLFGRYEVNDPAAGKR